MPRRRTFNRNGSLLDAPAGVDPASWANDNLLTKAKPPAAPPLCGCPPAQPNRLGGCRPALRWVGHDELSPYCAHCTKALQAGAHRRRDQLRMIALASMPIEHLDLEDLREWGVLSGDRPEPEPIDPAMAWPMPAPRPRGPIVPDAQAHANAAAALERDEAAMAAAATRAEAAL